jgi:hypothetical protein
MPFAQCRGTINKQRPFQFEFLPRQSHHRSVRFDEGSAAAVIASHDYRVTIS